MTEKLYVKRLCHLTSYVRWNSEDVVYLKADVWTHI